MHCTVKNNLLKSELPSIEAPAYTYALVIIHYLCNNSPDSGCGCLFWEVILVC